MTAELSFTEAFTSALRGIPTRVAHSSGESRMLPVETWSADADDSDHALLDLCRGSTLDIGCGPGRLTHELTRRGHQALGVDLVEEAVHLTRRRGAAAMLADVFHPVPREGRWGTALLADGNVGISGDPVHLLRRVRQLLHPGGRAVVEVSGPGTTSSVGWSHLELEHGRSRPFRWAFLAVDDVATVAVAAGLLLTSVHRLAPHEGARWAAVLDGPT
jgi:SAM-dependent methyltransferase